MMFHASSANESFANWSICGTALHHLIVPADEQKLLDQIKEWNEVLDGEPNNSENHILSIQTPQKTCIFDPISKNRNKEEELLQKSENEFSDKRKLFANRQYPSRRCSTGEHGEKSCEVSKLQRSPSLPSITNSSVIGSPSSTQELFNTLSDSSDKVQLSTEKENNKLNLTDEYQNSANTTKLSTSSEHSNIEISKVALLSNIAEKVKSPLKKNSASEKSTNDLRSKKIIEVVARGEVEAAVSITKKLPFKKSLQASHDTKKTSKVNDKKRILNKLKNTEGKNGTENDSDREELPNKKQKTKESIDNVHSVSITTAKCTDKLRNSEISRQSSCITTKMKCNEQQLETCLTDEPIDICTKSLTLSNLSTPQDIHILNNIQLSEKDSQDVQETVQNLSDVICQEAEVTNKISSNFSQPEIFKDLDISSDPAILNSNEDYIPNSNDIINSNVDLNTSRCFLSKESLPFSQIPHDNVSHGNGGVTFSENVPPQLTSEVRIQNSSIPQLIKEANPPTCSEKNMPSQIPTLSTSSVVAHEILSVDLLKDIKNQCSTPVEEGILPMKMTQENMFSVHPEDFMNISSSSSIPCGQAPKPLSYVPSLPSSQESDDKATNLQGSADDKMGHFMVPQVLDKNAKTIDDIFSVLPGGSQQIPKINVDSALISSDPLCTNDNNPQTNSEFASKILAARKKLVFHKKEGNTGKHLKVPPVKGSNERKRKHSKDLKSHPYKKAKLISIEFTQGEISSMIETLKDLFS